MKPTPAQLRALARRDPRLGVALKATPPFPGFPVPQIRALSHYQFLARSILFQQLAKNAASTIHRRVCALTPGPRFPKPEEFLALSREELRGAGLSRNKYLSVRDLAERVAGKRLVLASIGRRPDEEVIERLVEVRGIGEWTAQMFLLFRLGRLDVMPSTDLGVQEGVKRVYRLRKRPDPKQVEKRGEAWAPLRSVGAWAMWQVLDNSVKLPN